MSWRRWSLALLAIAAIHIAVRVPLLDRERWVDESVGVLFSTQPLDEAWRLAHDTYSPPLHLMMMSTYGEVARLAGWESTMPREGVAWSARHADRSFYALIPLEDGGVAQTSDFEQWDLLPLSALRLTSLALSLATLLLAALFARRSTGSAAVGIGVGVLLAVAPAAALWDTTVRYLSPVMLPILAMAWLLWEIGTLETTCRRWWLFIALAMATALALLTHYVAAFFGPPLGLWLLLVCGKRRLHRTAGAAVAMLAGLGIFLIVWGGGFRAQWAGSGLADPVLNQGTFDWLNRFPLQPVLPFRLLVGMDGQTGVFAHFPSWWVVGLLWVLLIAVLGYLARLMLRQGGRLDALLLLWIFGPAALSVVVEVFQPNTAALAWRQFMGGAPAAALMFVLGIGWVSMRLPKRSSGSVASREGAV